MSLLPAAQSAFVQLSQAPACAHKTLSSDSTLLNWGSEAGLGLLKEPIARLVRTGEGQPRVGAGRWEGCCALGDALVHALLSHCL